MLVNIRTNQTNGQYVRFSGAQQPSGGSIRVMAMTRYWLIYAEHSVDIYCQYCFYGNSEE